MFLFHRSGVKSVGEIPEQGKLQAAIWPKIYRYDASASLASSCLPWESVFVNILVRIEYLCCSNTYPPPRTTPLSLSDIWADVFSILCPFQIGYFSTVCPLMEQPLSGMLGHCSREKRSMENHLPYVRASAWRWHTSFVCISLAKASHMVASEFIRAVTNAFLPQGGSEQGGVPAFLVNKMTTLGIH